MKQSGTQSWLVWLNSEDTGTSFASESETRALRLLKLCTQQLAAKKDGSLAGQSQLCQNSRKLYLKPNRLLFGSSCFIRSWTLETWSAGRLKAMMWTMKFSTSALIDLFNSIGRKRNTFGDLWSIRVGYCVFGFLSNEYDFNWNIWTNCIAILVTPPREHRAPISLQHKDFTWELHVGFWQA